MANIAENGERQFVISSAEDDSCVSCHSCSSSMVKYTDEFFTSYTDGNETGQSYSQSFESYPFDEEFETTTESEVTTIKSEMESLSPPNIKQEMKEEFECCEDPEDLRAKQKFIEKCLDMLNKNKFVSSPHHVKEQYMVFRKEAAQSLPVESAPLQMYCHMKIQQIHQQFQAKQSESCKHGKPHSNKPFRRKTVPQRSCIVPQQLINRIRFKCTSEKVKQVMETSMHQPSICTACVKKLGELAEHNFLRVKSIQLEEMLIQDKIEEHIYTKDTLTQIGKIHRSLPKYSDATTLVWKRLFDRKTQT
ncbi:uncharacterized protein C8orf48 homolog [Rhincodon typus]|uniref:uncharacterized protein C8orf48 homolog n=1 Tax=Rhincodon typus TaxID=259920 RepID=UPI00202E7AEB|nr:uncharacterized protein C8orf48 homolog [Rhincodon typus]XP_048461172.1 uncharacterized protein C8orf48 homolog [Rhincodon typus]XP_048461173.1 uncharacterized protein C8orf48 homolog [Rhincodon typus]